MIHQIIKHKHKGTSRCIIPITNLQTPRKTNKNTHTKAQTKPRKIEQNTTTTSSRREKHANKPPWILMIIIIIGIMLKIIVMHLTTTTINTVAFFFFFLFIFFLGVKITDAPPPCLRTWKLKMMMMMMMMMTTSTLFLFFALHCQSLWKHLLTIPPWPALRPLAHACKQATEEKVPSLARSLGHKTTSKQASPAATPPGEE